MINLTLEGYLYLQQKIQSDERLAWFSIEDIVRGETVDGQIPYIKALYDDFSDDREALGTKLINLPDSFSSAYHFQPKKYGVTLPVDSQNPILAGVLGKDKPLNLSLSVRQLQILLGLAAHLRGFEFSTHDKNFTLHPFGWIEVSNNNALQSELIEIANFVYRTDLVVENRREVFFRLSIIPEVIFFDVKLFSFIVKQDDLNATKSKIPVLIKRNSFDTALGLVKEKTEAFQLTLELVHKLKSLSVKQYSTESETAVKIEDTYKKGLHKESRFLALGLRSLICRDAGIIKFNIDYTVI